MKKLTSLLLLAVLPLMASAYDAIINGICYDFDNERNTATVTYENDGFSQYMSTGPSSSYSGSVTIPSTVVYEGKTYKVTAIDGYAFISCENLTSVTIGSNVKEIGAGAFSNCTGLTSFTIPNNVTTIKSSAFAGCTGLTEVTIGSGVTHIGDGVFNYCTNIKSVYCHATEVPEFGWWPFDNIPYYTPLFVPEESVDSYREKWGGFFGIILPLGSEVPADVVINEENFPDANFRNFLLSQEYGADGVLSYGDLDQIYNLDVSNKGIQNLKGLEYFFALSYLYIYQNCIKGDAMDALIEALPVAGEGTYWFAVMYNTGEQNEMTSAQVAAAKAKGWIPKEYNGSYWSDYDPSTNVVINETNFPDENFRNWVLSQTYGADGVLTANEVSRINTIDVTNEGIKRLKGIEYFTAMRYFYCSRNQIKGTAMDELIECLPSSSNSYIMYVFDNQYVDEKNVMTTTQVAASKAKGWIPYYNAGREGWKEYAGSEPGPEPDPGPDPEPSGDGVAINETNFPDANFRSWLLARDYGQDGLLTKEETDTITRIDVSWTQIQSLQGIDFFTALTYLNCYYDYNITSLDVSKNTALTHLDCSEMYYLTSLDVSKNTALTYLNCSTNKLTSIDLSKNTALTELNLYNNKLTSLDVSKNTALTKLNCSSNNLTSLDVSQNTALETLICGGGNLTSLNVSGCTALTHLDCSYNYWQLTSLDVSGCTALTYLDCSTNRLTSLDVSKNTALTELNCSGNVQLTSLNVSGCTALTKLECSDNQLTSLDMTGCASLTTLECYKNQLTSLNVSGCTALTMIECYQNQINESAMKAVVKNLPTVSGGVIHVIYNQDEQNVMSTTQVAAAKAKGWTPYKQLDRWWIEYAGSEPELEPEPGEGIAINETNFPDANFRNYLLEQEYGTDGIITSDEIEGVTSMFVSEKDIESLEGIEYFKKLQYLYCDNNKLTSLDVSNNTAMQALICNNNKLTSLNVSEYSELYWLYIYQNQIKGAAMDSLVKHLPIVRDGSLFVIYNENEGNVMTSTQVAAAKAKGWSPAYCTGQAYNEQWDEYYDVWRVIPDVLRGDVNGDGKVDMEDVTFVTNIILGTEEATEAADVNNDGQVSMPDAMFIVNKILNGKFPDE